MGPSVTLRVGRGNTLEIDLQRHRDGSQSMETCGATTSLSCSVDSVQLDNCDPGCEFAVVLACHPPSRGTATPTALDFSVEFSRPPEMFALPGTNASLPSANQRSPGAVSATPCSIPRVTVLSALELSRVSLHVHPFQLQGEDSLAFCLAHFASHLIRDLVPAFVQVDPNLTTPNHSPRDDASQDPLASTVVHVDSAEAAPCPRSFQSDPALDARFKTATSPWITIRRLDVSDISFRLTLHSSEKASVLHVGAEQMPLHLNAVALRHVHCDPARLVQELAASYLADAIVQSPMLLGSLQLLGNPTFLLHSMARGVSDLLSLPRDAFRHGGSSVVGAVGSGMLSLVRHTAQGTLTSLSGFSSSLAWNLDRLAPQDTFSRQRQLEPLPLLCPGYWILCRSPPEASSAPRRTHTRGWSGLNDPRWRVYSPFTNCRS